MHALQRLVAITSPENHRSIKLLEKLGFTFERLIRLTATAPESKLFAWPVVADSSRLLGK